jgi:hypothetical protein
MPPHGGALPAKDDAGLLDYRGEDEEEMEIEIEIDKR